MDTTTPVSTESTQTQSLPTQTENTQKLAPISQLFAESYSLYKEHVTALVTLVVAPLALLGLGELLSAHGSNLLGAALSILGFLLFVPSGIAMLLNLSKGLRVPEAYRAGLALCIPAIWVSILMYFVMIGGFILLIIPGLILSVSLSFGLFVLVFENKRGLTALQQSREYVRGYWWAIVGRFLALLIPIEIVLVISTLIFGQEIGSVVYFVIMIAVAPFYAVYYYKIYSNLVALKPAVASSQPTSGRGFLVTTGIIGLLAPIILIIIFGALFISLITNGNFDPATLPIQDGLNQTYPI